MTKGIARMLCAVAMVTMAASTASALAPLYACDKAKGRAAGKCFASVMKCKVKGFANSAYDEAGCIAAAETKCEAAFEKADDKYPADCNNVGNGPNICGQSRDSAINLYGGI